MTTLDDLHAELDEMQRLGMAPEYFQKMMHRIPTFPVIDREEYIVARCKDQRILNLGSASGRLHEMIKSSAIRVIGVDHETGPNTDVWLDFDDYEALQAWQLPDMDLIVFAETIEHLLMPGAVLRKLRQRHAPLLITTPNAHCAAGLEWARRGYDQVNPEHCMWFSYHTLKVILERTGWTPEAWAYYGSGPIGLNEGIIVLAR